MKVLVTGASGQLGSALKKAVATVQTIDVVFLSATDLDITNATAVNKTLGQGYAYCVNCAAYTQVDQAETAQEQAYTINVTGPALLAKACKKQGTVLIHISTDFVFDGVANQPYTEEDLPKPLGVYGQTKYQGEQAIVAALDAHFIVRTSWLYSLYGHNFLKTMLRLGTTTKALSVVADQLGTPTYAGDLAQLILKIISSKSTQYGLYHYSNQGQTSWYGFAQAIFELSQMPVALQPISTAQYPTPAKRPKYSVLAKDKIQKAFKLSIPHWQDSLAIALKALQEKEG